MSWIKEEDLKAIRQQADIVDVISHYLSVTKKGRNYAAICPFHDDHDPSLSISSSKQIFKCFVCGAGGDVFGFVRRIENLSYPEAVSKVADIIGYHLELNPIVIPVRKDEHQSLHDLLQEYIRFCAYELVSVDGIKANEYLTNRSVNEDIINRFEIGYAPGNAQTLKFFNSKKFRMEDLIASGVVNEYEGNISASFTDRIMIPIHDPNGKPVGFTARRLTNDVNVPKYINTSQTEIYEKGNLVFNFHRAKNFARKNNRLILVEGAMDVIAFEKADIHESVACLGTACTQTQLSLLRSLRVPVLVCYDGDRAGREATYKFGKMAVNQGVDIQIVKNSSSMDPDEIFASQGKEGLEALVRKTSSFTEFLIEFLPKKYNLENYEEKKQFVEEIREVINQSDSAFEKANHYAQIKALTGYDLSLDTPKKVSPKTNRVVPVYMQAPPGGRFQAEKVCLQLILLSKEASNRFKDEIGFFKDNLCNELALYIFDMYRSSSKIDPDRLIARIDEEEVRNFYIRLQNDNDIKEFNEELFVDSMLKIKECSLQEQIDLINQKIKALESPKEKIELASQKQNLIVQKNALRRKEG